MPAKKKKNRVKKKVQKQTPDRTGQSRAGASGTDRAAIYARQVTYVCIVNRLNSFPFLFFFWCCRIFFFLSPSSPFPTFSSIPSSWQTDKQADWQTHSLTNSFHCIMLHFRASFGQQQQQQQQQLETNTQFQVWSGQLNFSI